MKKPILVFDMDGVLVDVTESYRETIVAEPCEHFTGRRISHAEIQDYKIRGGCQQRLGCSRTNHRRPRRRGALRRQ